jgi:uncharacterized membrane protein YphA (DoxX/SURF4 family)
MSGTPGLLAAQLLAAAFLAVLFLQSGLDKVLDWQGNRAYIAGFFAKSPLRRFSTPLLLAITVLEVLAGVLSAAGALSLLVTGDAGIAFLGACTAGVSMLGLFFGQRIAKDYAAAAGMVPYFLLALLAVLLEGGVLR